MYSVFPVLFIIRDILFIYFVLSVVSWRIFLNYPIYKSCSGNKRAQTHKIVQPSGDREESDKISKPLDPLPKIARSKERFLMFSFRL